MGQYKITVKLSAGKFYSDSSGNEHAAPMNDYIDIGVFAGEKALLTERHRLTSGEYTMGFIVQGKPTSVRIDPYKWLMDRNGRDNEKNF